MIAEIIKMIQLHRIDVNFKAIVIRFIKKNFRFNRANVEALDIQPGGLRG